MQSSVPDPDPRDDMSNIQPQAAVIFQEKLEAIEKSWKAGRKRNKGVKNQRDRVRRHIAWGRSTKRVQRYLGLRQARSRDVTEMPGDTETLEAPRSPRPHRRGPAQAARCGHLRRR